MIKVIVTNNLRRVYYGWGIVTPSSQDSQLNKNLNGYLIDSHDFDSSLLELRRRNHIMILFTKSYITIKYVKQIKTLLIVTCSGLIKPFNSVLYISYHINNFSQSLMLNDLLTLARYSKTSHILSMTGEKSWDQDPENYICQYSNSTF